MRLDLDRFPIVRRDRHHHLLVRHVLALLGEEFPPHRHQDRVRLQPANSLMKPFYAKADNVEIQGRVLTVIRQMLGH